MWVASLLGYLLTLCHSGYRDLSWRRKVVCDTFSLKLSSFIQQKLLKNGQRLLKSRVYENGDHWCIVHTNHIVGWKRTSGQRIWKVRLGKCYFIYFSNVKQYLKQNWRDFLEKLGLRQERCCSVVVITSALHAKGPRFEPVQHQRVIFLFFERNSKIKCDNNWRNGCQFQEFSYQR